MGLVHVDVPFRSALRLSGRFVATRPSVNCSVSIWSCSLLAVRRAHRASYAKVCLQLKAIPNVSDVTITLFLLSWACLIPA